MNCVFKGFFENAADAEVAYFALRQKHLAYDLETSDLASSGDAYTAPTSARAAAYAAWNNTIQTNAVEDTGLTTGSLFSINDPRVVLMPFLSQEKKTSSAKDAFYLYGHCSKKDLNAVKQCMKHCGAFSVLTSESGHTKNGADNRLK